MVWGVAQEACVTSCDTLGFSQLWSILDDRSADSSGKWPPTQGQTCQTWLMRLSIGMILGIHHLGHHDGAIVVHQFFWFSSRRRRLLAGRSEF